MSRHLEVELLSSYVDEEVTTNQLRLVEDHLGDCAECRHTLSGLRAVAAGVRRLETVAPPPTLAAAVERRVRLAALDEPRVLGFEDGLRRWLGQPVLAPLFAIVLALGAILYLFALGVSERERTTTRVVVASAPDEEEKRALEKRRALADDFEVPAPEMTVIDSFETATGRGDNLSPKAETAPIAQAVPAEADRSGEQDSQLRVGSRVEAAKPAAVVAEAASPALAEGSFAPEAPEARSLAGRTFGREAGVWVEIGLEGQAAVELVDLRASSARLDAELAPFRDLGRVRLRLDDRIVEVIYPAAVSRE